MSAMCDVDGTGRSMGVHRDGGQAPRRGREAVMHAGDRTVRVRAHRHSAPLRWQKRTRRGQGACVHRTQSKAVCLGGWIRTYVHVPRHTRI